jgi:hypothetical protein
MEYPQEFGQRYSRQPEWGSGRQPRKLQMYAEDFGNHNIFQGGLLMKKLALYVLCAAMMLVGASEAGACLMDLNSGRGANIRHDQTIFIEFREAIHKIVSSAPGNFVSFQNDYNSWRGSGRNIDWAFMLPTSLFSGDNLNDHVDLHNELAPSGELGLPSQASFEEYAPREPGAPVPEPATMLLLGFGLIGLAGLGRKKLMR